MCRAMGWKGIAPWLLVLAACGDEGLEQAADEGGSSSGGSAEGGPTSLPPMLTTASAGGTSADDGVGTSAPETGDPSASTGDPTDPDASASATTDGADMGASSDDAAATTTGTADCADHDAGSDYPLTLADTTTDAPDDFTPGCGLGEGEDVSIRWTAPAAGTYLIDTMGSDIDTILAVWSDCDGREIACHDDIDASGKNIDLDSALAVELSAGESILIVVDGANTPGDFVLHVTWYAYGNCHDYDYDVVCGPGEACFSNASIGVCGVPFCDTVADCPDPPPDGTAPVVCRDLGGDPPGDCGLDCSGGQTCPTGMTCVGGNLCYW